MLKIAPFSVKKHHIWKLLDCFMSEALFMQFNNRYKFHVGIHYLILSQKNKQYN